MSPQEIFNKLITSKHRTELVLIFLAVVAAVSAVLISLSSDPPQKAVLAATSSPPAPPPQSVKKISVEVSGAVMRPDVYLVEEGTHLKKAIDLAGGLSGEADILFVARNFNMAKYLVDQEKIYVPYTFDITNGTFTEEKRILEYLQPRSVTKNQTTTETKDTSSTTSLSLNTASVEELDTLPGIGPVSAQKIIDNRPYSSPQELTEKKVINASTFEKIKDFISL